MSILEKKEKKVYLIDIVNSSVIINEYQIINKQVEEIEMDPA